MHGPGRGRGGGSCLSSGQPLIFQILVQRTQTKMAKGNALATGHWHWQGEPELRKRNSNSRKTILNHFRHIKCLIFNMDLKIQIGNTCCYYIYIYSIAFEILFKQMPSFVWWGDETIRFFQFYLLSRAASDFLTMKNELILDVGSSIWKLMFFSLLIYFRSKLRGKLRRMFIKSMPKWRNLFG